MQPKSRPRSHWCLGATSTWRSRPSPTSFGATERCIARAWRSSAAASRNWDIRIADTIADNASSGLLVLGGPAEDDSKVSIFATLVMTMRRREEMVSTGSGSRLPRTSAECGGVAGG